MRPKELPTNFAAHLRRRRQQLDLTRADLAHRVGCSADTIKKLERGLRRPSKQLALLLAQHLGITDEEVADFLHAARRRNLPVPGNLPAYLTGFVGRDTEMTQIAQLMRNQEARLITLVGAPGVGKSRLAVQSAHTLAADFSDGAWYLDGSRYRPTAHLIPLLAQLFGLPDGTSPFDWLPNILRTRRALLVLDGFDPFLADAKALVDLLTQCPQLSALVTCSVPLRIYGEQRIIVSPLAIPLQWETSEQLAHFPVVQLFIARVRAHHPNFRLTADNAAAVVALCAQLDGIPLAVELAAGRADAATPHLLLDEIERQGRLDITPDTYDEAAHHATMRIAIAHALAPLEATTREFFAALSLFHAPFDAGAAQAVAAPDAKVAQVRALLNELIAHHLVQPLSEDNTLQYRLLDTLREAASALLGPAPDLRRRHAAYFAHHAQAIDPTRTLGNLHMWRAWLRQTYADWLAALEFSRTDHREDRDTALWLAAVLGHVWYLEGNWHHGVHQLERLLAQPGGTPAVRSRVYSEMGILLSALGDYRTAKTAFITAYEQGQQADDCYAQLWALAHQVHLLQLHGRVDEMRKLNQARARLTHRLSDTRYRALTLEQMGSEAIESGDDELGTPWLQEALALWKAQNAPGSIGSIYCVLGMSALAQGDAPRALTDFLSAYAEFSRVPHSHGLPWVLRNLGLAYIALGRLVEARRTLQESLSRYCTLHSKNGPLIIVEASACYAAALGARELAVRLMACALARRAHIGLPLTVNSRRVYTQLYLATDELAIPDLAPADWEEALAQTNNLLAEVPNNSVN